MIRYRHAQAGHLMRLALGLPVLAMLAALPFLQGTERLIVLGVASGLAGVLLLFHRLDVQVDETHLGIRFGIGLIRARFALAEIRAAGPVRTPWIAGWGIRLLDKGFLFNVSGPDAVEITLASGRIHRIGTDEPEALARALRDALAARDADRHG